MIHGWDAVLASCQRSQSSVYIQEFVYIQDHLIVIACYEYTYLLPVAETTYRATAPGRHFFSMRMHNFTNDQLHSCTTAYQLMVNLMQPHNFYLQIIKNSLDSSYSTHNHFFRLSPYLSAMFLAIFIWFMPFSAWMTVSQQLFPLLSTHALER